MSTAGCGLDVLFGKPRAMPSTLVVELRVAGQILPLVRVPPHVIQYLGAVGVSSICRRAHREGGQGSEIVAVFQIKTVLSP